ncbi:MAG: AAA family ATPase [Gemmatimonadales bacterium]
MQTPFLEAVRLGPYKGIISLTLSGLEQVTVLCGRNGAGKSSVMEAINIPAKCIPGRTIGDKESMQLAEAFVKNAGVNSSQLGRVQLGYHGLIQEICTTRPVWFASERDEFVSLVAEQRPYRPVISQFPIDVMNARADFEGLFQPRPRITLVPPKRNIEAAATIQTQQSVQPNGQGVANVLFHASTQLKGKPEKVLVDNIQESFTRLTRGSSFRLTTDRNNQVQIFFEDTRGVAIDADNSGLGLRDLLAILWHAHAPDADVVLLEEPENHLNPDLQRRLLAELCGQKHKQFIISTHSNIFVDTSRVGKLILLNYVDNVAATDATDRGLALAEMGYSSADNLISDTIVLVEGPSDAEILEEFFDKADPEGKHIVRFWPLGGDTMSRINLSVFSRDHRVFALIDRDAKSDKVRRDFEEHCKQAGIPCHRLKRAAIENYIPLTSYRAVFKGQVMATLDKLKDSESVEQQLGFSVKRKARQLAQLTSIDAILETDLGEFVRLVHQAAPLSH